MGLLNHLWAIENDKRKNNCGQSKGQARGKQVKVSGYTFLDQEGK
jgi:hypothetical protein